MDDLDGMKGDMVRNNTSGQADLLETELFERLGEFLLQTEVLVQETERLKSCKIRLKNNFEHTIWLMALTLFLSIDGRASSLVLTAKMVSHWTCVVQSIMLFKRIYLRC